MNPAGASPELLSVWIQIAGTLLFSLVFLFLWRQSGIVYFGLWSAAWAAQAGAMLAGVNYLSGGALRWLLLYAFLQYAFAVFLVSAARAGFSAYIRDWKAPLKILLAFPLFLAVVWRLGGRPEAFYALHATLLGAVYVYNYASIGGTGIGGKVFRFSLLSLAAAFFYHASMFVYLYFSGRPPAWERSLHFATFYDFALDSMLAFAAMAMWIESQHDRVRELGTELDRVRRESELNLDLDRLTGLLNQSALSKRMEDAAPFRGVVVVCDMDAFKEINDRYGHLVGDEILRNIGHLLRSSIRPEDEAFRWGGDEFVILFHNQQREVASNRMEEIANRLRGFRVRGHGVLPISFSWGTADSDGRPLREAVDLADRTMYGSKRSRRG